MLIDGDGLLWAAVETPLRAHGYEPQRGRSFGEALLLLSERRFDLVLAPEAVNGRSVHAVMKLLREVHRGVLLILDRGGRVTAAAEADNDLNDIVAWQREVQALMPRMETVRAHSGAVAQTDATVTMIASGDPVASSGVWHGSARSRMITTPNGRRLHLTKTAYALLVYLVSRRGEVVTRSELIEVYQGSGADAHKPYMLGVMIAQLRAILSPHLGRQPAIHTVHGIGYIFSGFDLVEDNPSVVRDRPGVDGVRPVSAGQGLSPTAREANWQSCDPKELFVVSVHCARSWNCSASTRTITTPDGHKLKLTRAEYDVLVYLARRRGQLVTRRELAEIFPPVLSQAPRVRGIGVLICVLRAKLLPYMAGQRAIQTVRGEGYIFMGFDLTDIDMPVDDEAASSDADHTCHDPSFLEHIPDPGDVLGG